MTGCYPPRVSLAFNHMPNSKTGIHPGETTNAEVLKTASYATLHLGKWHSVMHRHFYRLGTALMSTSGCLTRTICFPIMFPYHEMLPVQENEPPLQQAIRQRSKYTGSPWK